jgi:hypothetical protein
MDSIKKYIYIYIYIYIYHGYKEICSSLWLSRRNISNTYPRQASGLSCLGGALYLVCARRPCGENEPSGPWWGAIQDGGHIQRILAEAQTDLSKLLTVKGGLSVGDTQPLPDKYFLHLLMTLCFSYFLATHSQLRRHRWGSVVSWTEGNMGASRWRAPKGEGPGGRALACAEAAQRDHDKLAELAKKNEDATAHDCLECLRASSRIQALERGRKLLWPRLQSWRVRRSPNQGRGGVAHPSQR